MAISNNSTGLRPGVCTSTTRPTAPYEGQMIYETDTDLTYVWGGSAWQQVSGGTAVGNSGLVYVTSYSVGSGVSLIEVPNAFNSTYNNYKVIYSGGSGSSAAVGLRLGLTGSSSAYFNGIIYIPYGASAVSAISNNNNYGYWQYAGAADSNSNAFLEADIFEPFLARSTRFFSQWVQTDANGSNSGIHKANTSFTGLTIGMDSGTVSGGTVTVYGYRKA